ncbi:hypothetical protein B0A52_08691 [Exophiala mesophila]|uniref:Hypervirulence associated protein TUDOR domain-containing protein n=1 Tax=Exophiala mesophila TaxID=212818 RepID=A0A438MYI8_EXOME|nr:hypothetical protein B0A52_08691 [Exophiala mesophila]
MAPAEEPEKGDKVSWNWGGGAPGGKVAEKKTEGEIAITSKKGNKIKKNAEPNNPAVHIERSGNDVVKKASELNIEQKANGSSGGGGATDKDKDKDDGGSKSGNNKRKHDQAEKKGDGALEENAEGKTVKPGGKDSPKKQKQESTSKEDKKEDVPNGEPKRKAGRPKKGEGASSKKKDATPRSTDGIGSRTRSRT